MTSTVPFVSGRDGYHTYRIPALLALGGGTLLAFAEGRVNAPADHGNIDIVLRRSLDGGATWLPVQTAQSEGTQTVHNPAVAVDPATGDVLLVWCLRSGTSAAIRRGDADPPRVYVQRSQDAGATWSPKREITSQARPPWMRMYGTGPGHAVVLAHGPHAGRIVVPCWHTRTPTGADTGTETHYYGVHVIYSDDGGTTWALGAVSSTPDGQLNENETAAAELPDGRLYFSARCLADAQPGNRADAFSTDGGATLAEPYRPQPGLPLPNCHGSVLALPDGRLVHSGPLDPEERAGMGLWISRDEGRTWALRHAITHRPAAYSDLAVDGTNLLVLYETGDAGTYERIELERVPLAALT